MESEKSILVVDDNAINREVLREILKTEYSVREAENGEEALRIMREMPDRILAVLSDIVMPLIDGFQLLEEISNDSKLGNIPIIVMTVPAVKTRRRSKPFAWAPGILLPNHIIRK